MLGEWIVIGTMGALLAGLAAKAAEARKVRVRAGGNKKRGQR